MNYKTWKRKDQRKRAKARQKYWQAVRDDDSLQAFKEWTNNWQMKMYSGLGKFLG